MAIPLIGSLSDLNQSANLALQSQRYLGESLTKMGAQIGNTISERQMFSDADKAAPFMQHAFLSAFDTIAAGDINGGLGKAIGAAAQFSTNPILARIAQEGVRTAGLMTNTVMEKYQQENQNYRTQLGIDAFDQRTNAKLDIATEKVAAGLQEELRKRQEIINNPIVPDEAKVQAKAEADSIVTKLQAMQSQALPPQQQSNEPDVTIVNEDFVGPMPQGSSAPDQTPLTQPIGAVGRVGNVQPPQQPTQPSGSPTAAPQPQGGAIQKQDIQSTSYFGDDQTVRAMGGNLIITDARGSKMTLEGMTVKDGSVSMSLKAQDGTLFDLGKEATDAANDVITGASRINSDINAFFQTNGGLIKISAVDFPEGNDDQGYTMRVKTPITTQVVGKDGKVEAKTEIVDRIYSTYDENGKRTPILVSKADREWVEKMEGGVGILKKTLNKKGTVITDAPSKNTPEDVRFSAAQDVANRPFPFNLNEAEVLKNLGQNPEAVAKDAGLMIAFKARAGALLDKMEKSGDFKDPKDKNAELPIEKQITKYQERLKKDAKDWKVGDKPMFPPNKEKETTPRLELKDVVDDDIVASMNKEGFFEKAMKMAGSAIASAAGVVKGGMKEVAIRNEYAKIKRSLDFGLQYRKLTKDQYERGIAQNEEKMKAALAAAKKSQ